jgi:hypothetical protein
MTVKTKFHQFQEQLFDLFILLTYILLFISALGFDSGTQILIFLDTYVRIYICLFLMWRFNPLRKHYEFTNLDRKIAFSAGLFILTTTALNKYLENIKSYVRNHFYKNNV